MKIKYDIGIDTVYIHFNNQLVKESYEVNPGFIIDYSDKDLIVAIEILDASKKFPSPGRIEYESA